MDTTEKLKVLREKNREIEKLKGEAYDISKGIFDEWCRDFFERNEAVGSFSWNQYTPYFNDGDSCVFSANTDYIKVNGEYAEDSDWISEKTIKNYGTFNRETKKYEGRVEVANESYDPELAKATREIQDFLQNFDSEFYISRFGDHTEITVSRDGIEVEDYEHE